MTVSPHAIEGTARRARAQRVGIAGRRFVLTLAMSMVVLGGCMFFDEIDRCLDRGGGWDEATETCEFEEREREGRDALAPGAIRALLPR